MGILITGLSSAYVSAWVKVARWYTWTEADEEDVELPRVERGNMNGAYTEVRLAMVMLQRSNQTLAS